MKNNFIIVGWNERTRELIDMMLSKELNNLVIIDSTIDSLTDQYQNMKLIKGHAYDDDILREANINDANTILISSDLSLTEKEADKLTILICVAAKGCNPNIKVITEIRNEYQIKNARSAGANSVIWTNNVVTRVLFHQLYFSQFNQFFNKLSSQKFNAIKAPSNIIGETFLNTLVIFINEGETLVGINRADKIIMNPNHDTVIKEDDELITMKSDS